MHVGVLPEIDRREVEAEHVDRAPERAQPPARQDAAIVVFQRFGDRREVGGEFVDRFIGRGARADRLSQRGQVVEFVAPCGRGGRKCR